MDLTVEQKACVSAWVEEGMGLSDIQKRLKDGLGIGLTFMDVRFLVSDLQLQLKTREKKSATDDLESGGPIEPEAEDAPPIALADDSVSTRKEGGVTVEVDKVIRPGASVSGSVTFTDGKKAEWYMDQFGQLGIVPPEEGYKPSEEDVQAFQMELRNVLQRSPF